MPHPYRVRLTVEGTACFADLRTVLNMSEVRYPNVPAPALVLDFDTAAQACTEVISAFDDGLGPVDVWYAVKCNPHPVLLEAVASAGGGFEAASVAEVHKVTEHTQVSASAVPFTNPVKSPKQVRDAMALGVRMFTVDDVSEVDKVSAAAALLGATDVSLAVRIAVDNSYAAFALDGKFGVSPLDVPVLARRAKALSLPITGISFHVGSQALNPQAWSAALRQAAYAFEAARDAGHDPHFVDLGGGFPAQYHDGTPSIQDVAEAVGRAWVEHTCFQGVRRAVEPGRFIAAPSGTYRANVLGVVERGGQRWIHTDVGAYNGPNESSTLRDSFLLPVAVQPHRAGALELGIVTGPTCDPSDTLTPPVPLPQDIRLGDVVEVGMAGAYSYALASSFNGFEPPVVYTARAGVVEPYSGVA